MLWYAVFLQLDKQSRALCAEHTWWLCSTWRDCMSEAMPAQEAMDDGGQPAECPFTPVLRHAAGADALLPPWLLVVQEHGRLLRAHQGLKAGRWGEGHGRWRNIVGDDLRVKWQHQQSQQ